MINKEIWIRKLISQIQIFELKLVWAKCYVNKALTDSLEKIHETNLELQAKGFKCILQLLG